MGAINLPANIQNDDPLDAGEVMADFQAITQVVNGSLEADSNVSTAAAATQPGSANSEGVAATLSRSDHLHLMQGFENLAFDPTTGNFKGRVYWSTASSALRYCTDATGTGTYAPLTPTAAELVVHAAQHKDGGHDPLADNTLTDHMFAAKGSIFQATLGADHTNINDSGWSNIIDLTTVITTGVQTLGIYVSMRFTNSDSGGHNTGWRVVDVTNSNTTIGASEIIEVTHPNIQTGINGFFYYTTPAAGPRTLRVQASTTGHNTVDAKTPTGLQGETVFPPTIQAVIL